MGQLNAERCTYHLHGVVVRERKIGHDGSVKANEGQIQEEQHKVTVVEMPNAVADPRCAKCQSNVDELPIGERSNSRQWWSIRITHLLAQRWEKAVRKSKRKSSAVSLRTVGTRDNGAFALASALCLLHKTHQFIRPRV